MKHPQNDPASFQTDQHPPTAKHFFHSSFSLDYPCSFPLYVKLLLSLQEPQKHHPLPEAFLGFFTALVSLYVVHCSGLYTSLCH